VISSFVAGTGRPPRDPRHASTRIGRPHNGPATRPSDFHRSPSLTVIQIQLPGRIENAQVAVYLVYAARRGHAAVDRELYIPRSWTCDPDRCRAAGLGEDTVFATKPELAARMIGRFLDAGHHVGWGTRSMAATRSYGPRWKSAASATCLPSPAPTRWLSGVLSYRVAIPRLAFILLMSRSTVFRSW
jgi:hypothetical protein